MPEPLAGQPETLSGRVAIVTGAASGMGRATARLLAEQGAAVAVIDRADTVREVADEITASGQRALAVICDITDSDALPAAVEDIRTALGPIDIVVNVAGVGIGGPFEADDYDRIWDTAMAVNVTAQVRLVRACLPDLLRNGEGRIVNVASTEGISSTRNTSAYSASKHAVVGLTRSLAVELGRRGVTANCVCPGPINTGMTAQIPDDHKAVYAHRQVPIGRYGEPEEVAFMIAALVQPGASYVNGAIIPVDGGLNAQG